MWTKRKPNKLYLKDFGYKAYAYINKRKRGKLDYKVKKYIFVCYENHSKVTKFTQKTEE